MTVDYRKLRQLREESERNERAEEAKRKILPKSLSVLPSSIKSQEERNAEQKESHLAFVEKRKARQEETESKQAEQFERENRSFVGMLLSLVKTAFESLFVTRGQVDAIVRTIISTTFQNGNAGQVLMSADKTYYWGDAASSDMDYSDYAFGFTLNPDADNAAEVGINAGKVRHGTRAAVSVSSAKIVCSDQTWIFVAYTYGSTGTISSSASEPVDTETVHNHALYLVTITAGVASVESGDIKHLGDIFIPGAFA